MDVNIQLINESVSSYLTSLKINHPDFSISKLKEELKKLIGQEPAIEVKRKSAPINELLLKTNSKIPQQKELIEELNVFYIDIENNKPVKIKILF